MVLASAGATQVSTLAQNLLDYYEEAAPRPLISPIAVIPPPGARDTKFSGRVL